MHVQRPNLSLGSLDAAEGPQPGRHWGTKGRLFKQQQAYQIWSWGMLTAFPPHMLCRAVQAMHTRSWLQAFVSSSSISRWGGIPAALCCREPALQLM